jgi:hypothetical protein
MDHIVRSLHNSYSPVLIEPLDADPDQAVRRAAEMEDIAIAAGITLEQIHHG